MSEIVKQKIYFIYPPSPIMNREDRCQQPTSDTVVIPPLPPVDMMSLSAIAKKRGYETKFKDYSLFGYRCFGFSSIVVFKLFGNHIVYIARRCDNNYN